MSRLQRITYGVWLTVGLVVLVFAFMRMLYRPLSIVLAPLLFGLLIVYLLAPLVSWLERHRWHRLAATTLAYLTVAIVLGAVSVVLFPAVAGQLGRFADQAPELGTRFVELGNRALSAVGLRVRLGAGLDPDALAGEIQRFVGAAENRTAVLAVVGGLTGVANRLLHVVIAVLVGPVVAFYVLVDLPRLQQLAVSAVPPRHRAELIDLVHKVTRVVGGFVRGQLFIALLVGALASMGLAAVGLPFWLVIGIIAGVTNLIPLVGPLVAGALGALVALATHGLGKALIVVAVMTAVQQIDSHVLSPIIMGRTTRVHPLLVLLSLLVAGSLYGIFGMLVAVPVVAAGKALATHVWQTRVPWAEPRSETTAGLPGHEPTRSSDQTDLEADADTTAATASANP